MATNTAQREWLGLGTMGWGIYVLLVLVNLAVSVSVGGTVKDQLLIAGIIIVTGYVVIRFWKFVVGLFGRLFS